MAYYLVSGIPKNQHLEELADRLAREELVVLQPFGAGLHSSLRNARIRRDGVAVWEEEDYCQPPLKEERATVLDRYFDDLRVDAVPKGEGWRQIDAYPLLFPEFTEF